MSHLYKAFEDTKGLDTKFVDVDEADPTLTNDPREAIKRCDFEEARRITTNNQHSNSNYLKETSTTLVFEADEIHDELKNNADQIIDDLKEQASEEITRLTHEYQTKFVELEKVHRKEAELLKDRWIFQHKQAEKVAQKKIDNLTYTAQILATHQCYDAAITIRNNTNEKLNDIIGEKTGVIDKHFKQEFEVLISFHQAQYESLYDELQDAINLIKASLQTKISNVWKEVQYMQAMTPVQMIKQINESEDLSTMEKKSIITTLSPSQLTPAGSRTVSQLRMSRAQNYDE